MQYIISIIGYILRMVISITTNIIGFIFRIILVALAAGIAYSKGRSMLVWGGLTLIFPYTFFILLLIPRKQYRFEGRVAQEEAFKGKNPIIASVMALAAMIAKADGSVSKEEISIVKSFLCAQIGLTNQEVLEYADAFEYGKSHPEEYRSFTRIIVGHYRNRKDILTAIAFMFMSIPMQNGGMSEREEEQVKSILYDIGINQYEYQYIKGTFYRQHSQYQGNDGYQYYYNNGNAGSNQYYRNPYVQESESSLVKKYTEILGVDENASIAEIKKAYRKLVKEYHPDKMASENMPKEYVDFANQKIRDVNEAYEYLQKVRGE